MSNIIQQYDPKVGEAFEDLCKMIDGNSAFSPAIRELLRLCSVVTDRSAGGIRLHIEKALHLGATREEVLSAIMNCLPVTGMESIAGALAVGEGALQAYYQAYERRDPVCVSHYPNPTDSLPHAEMLERLDCQPPAGNEGAVYVHVPFCKPVCSFCPFHKIAFQEKKVMQYMEGVRQEIKRYGETKYAEGTRIRSVYFGGGTPSVLQTEQMKQLLEEVKMCYHLTEDAQISFEGSPATFTLEKLEGIRASGANRVSFGVQTFNPKLGGYLGLSHTPEEAVQAIRNAFAAGFENVGADLMYNLPGQSMKMWLEDVAKSVRMGLTHITLFSLCVVPGTGFADLCKQGKVPPVGTQAYEIDLYQAAKNFLESEGYIQYSVWDFAKPGFLDQHVLLYYTQQRDLFAHGPAAFGYLKKMMYINEGGFDEYLRRLKSGDVSAGLGREADPLEEMHGMMAKGLRMLYVDKGEFRERFGRNPEEQFPEMIAELQRRGLLVDRAGKISLTRKGIVWGNNICKEFFSSANRQSFESRIALAHGKKPESEQRKR